MGFKFRKTNNNHCNLKEHFECDENEYLIFRFHIFSQSTLSSPDQPLKLRPPGASGLPTIVKTPVMSPKSEKTSFTHELRLKSIIVIAFSSPFNKVQLPSICPSICTDCTTMSLSCIKNMSKCPSL